MNSKDEFEKQVQRQMRDSRMSVEIKHDPVGNIKHIINAIVEAHARKVIDDAWSDNRSPNMIIKNLNIFIAGYEYGKGISNAGPYQHIINKIERESDPEYAKYLELKKKFEDKTQ